MIELQYYRIAFPTIYAGVISKVFPQKSSILFVQRSTFYEHIAFVFVSIPSVPFLLVGYIAYSAKSLQSIFPPRIYSKLATILILATPRTSLLCIHTGSIAQCGI